VDSKAEYSV